MVENKLMKSKKKAGFKPFALCLVVCFVISQIMFTIPTFAIDLPGVNLALGESVTASQSYGLQTPEKAVNGTYTDKDDKWCTGWTSGEKWLMVDFGCLYEVNRWVVHHAGIMENPNYNTRDFRLQYSEDGSNWFTADTVTQNTANITQRSTLTFLARYVRLYIDYSDQVNNACARIYEFQLYYDQRTNIALNKTATANQWYIMEPPAKAVNGTYTCLGDKWSTGWSTQSKWLKVDLGQVYSIKRFKVVHAGAVESDYPQYNTRNFRIQKSSDGVNWQDVYVITDNTRSLTERTFTNAISTRYIRLKIDQGQQNDDACARIYEFQLYGN